MHRQSGPGGLDPSQRHPGYPAPRACRTCRDLAAAAVAEEMTDPAELGRFAPPAPT